VGDSDEVLVGLKVGDCDGLQLGDCDGPNDSVVGDLEGDVGNRDGVTDGE